eukprot:CAMPEP_0195622368 /NCGR_PEP_ID=MMETSP0815-20121206/16179_1 /TAXON_ID=97485 /ORGANISM="Prymnesium parvum, Strain Texoma1" /LENGTH=40 /DNA_ID= /DNA_START= /DNA_END= /DNA_ORIENTATION=
MNVFMSMHVNCVLCVTSPAWTYGESVCAAARTRGPQLLSK